jgi:IclR family KDG regulon transcriptional repressor
MRTFPSKTERGTQSYVVPMVARVLKVFEAFQTNGPRLFLTEVTESCKIPKASAFRLLETLRTSGYLARDEHGRYRVTYKLLEIASVAQERDPLRRVALPSLEQLHRDSGETINLGIFEEDHVAYAEVLESAHQLRSVPRIGSQGALHATALGKAVAAWVPAEVLSQFLRKKKMQRFTAKTITGKQAFRRELAKIREQGYAVDNEEETIGCICVAAPLFDRKGLVVGAISVSGISSRMTATRVAHLGPRIRETCLSLSQRLGFRGVIKDGSIRLS